MKVAFVSHPDCMLHDMGPHHPECPQRLSAIEDRLIASGLDIVLRHYQAPPATREQLARVHDQTYVDDLIEAAPEAGLVWLDGDTAMNSHTVSAALHAAGAVVYAVDLVMTGSVDSAFCGVRPPGHHAERRHAMGFCFFNNIAVATAHALEVHGLQRVAIVDFDVHHGNGTEEIFREEPRVLFCSSFQHPFYPHTGADTDLEHIINVPLPRGSNSEAFRMAVQERWLPALQHFRPQLVMISAGFDAHSEDDMAGLSLHDADYAWVTRELKAIAETHANGRIVSTLEGGYALNALGRSVAAHLDALIG